MKALKIIFVSLLFFAAVPQTHAQTIQGQNNVPVGFNVYFNFTCGSSGFYLSPASISTPTFGSDVFCTTGTLTSVVVTGTDACGVPFNFSLPISPLPSTPQYTICKTTGVSGTVTFVVYWTGTGYIFTAA